MASSATIWTEIATIDGPHSGAPVLHSGAGWESAQAAIIALHGRGAGAYDILSLADMVARPNWARVAPQAAGATWYPMSFMAPAEQNEPYLSSALALVTALRDAVIAAGVPQERILLMGFSQGACLSLESAARLGGRWGGVAAMSGGLIGHALDEATYADSLEGTPVFIGCSDVDPHIPVRRVLESETVLDDQGAVVTAHLYPGMGHTVNEDELAHLRRLMNDIVAEQE
jgi:phospholipase/carboxylesterase